MYIHTCAHIHICAILYMHLIYSKYTTSVCIHIYTQDYVTIYDVPVYIHTYIQINVIMAVTSDSLVIFHWLEFMGPAHTQV